MKQGEKSEKGERGRDVEREGARDREKLTLAVLADS
jgi:hypothetical protein